MSDRVRVSVFDPATGETETSELDPGNYVLVVGERCEVTYHQFHFSSSTHQLTIKTNLPPEQTALKPAVTPPEPPNPVSTTPEQNPTPPIRPPSGEQLP